MEPAYVVIVALAVALAVATTVAIQRGDALDDVTRTLSRARTDEAARERAEAERETDDALLRDIVDEGLVWLDPGLRVRDANTRAHELLRHRRGALAGRSLIEAFLDTEVEGLALRAQQRGSSTAEVRSAGPDGPALIVRARRLAGGGVLLALGDVSELRRLQRIRREFIDNLSHELRTPLTTVSLLAETLHREAHGAGHAIPASMRERIAKIEVETGHIIQMVNELLDLSRIEGGGTLQMADGIDMGRLAADAAERLRLFAERQGVSPRIEVSDGLPPIRGDAVRLGQVVVNLLHNAVKFSPDGGEIVIRTVQDGSEVITSVEDHGVGIPRAARDRVFERFYKVDRARLRPEVGGGTGLGLAIARHVVEQHGGRIWVDSQEGVGSTFSFALPVADDTAAAHADRVG